MSKTNNSSTIRKGDRLDVLNDAGKVMSSKTIHSAKGEGQSLLIRTECGLNLRIGPKVEENANSSQEAVPTAELPPAGE